LGKEKGRQNGETTHTDLCEHRQYDGEKTDFSFGKHPIIKNI